MSVALAVVLGMAFATGAATSTTPLVDAARVHPAIRLDIRYATHDNFFKKQIYPEARCLLRRDVAPKLAEAARWLEAHHPGLVLLMKDCYRPASAQQILWDAVKGTPKSAYVASPRAGSIHSYGAAVDLTLADAKGRELDMGTTYDFLGPLAEPRREAEYLAAGKLTRAQIANRAILRTAMRAAGWKSIPNEWWHFDDGPKDVVRRRYPRLDVPFSAVP